MLLVLVFGFFLRKAESETGEVRTHVTHIEAASPCLTYGPHSAVCKESFEKAVATINRPEACAILRKADLEPSACKGVHLKIERIEERRGTSTGGDAQTQTPSGQQPSPPQGGHPGSSVGGSKPEQHPGSGVSNPPEASQPVVSEAPPPAEAPAAETPHPSHPPHPETPAPKAPVREAVAGVGETVNGALEGVGDTGCKLLGCKP